MVGGREGGDDTQPRSKAPSVCECVSHGQSVPLCWIRGGPVRGEEANGRTHLLSLLLPVATADIGAERDIKQPPTPRKREERGTQERQGIWREMTMKNRSVYVKAKTKGL